LSDHYTVKYDESQQTYPLDDNSLNIDNAIVNSQ